MNQVGLKEMLFDVFQTILVHPQHLQLAHGIDFRRTNINLHVGMVCAFDFLDLKRFCHILAVADREDDGVALLGQRVDHADAEVAQCRVVGRGKPTQQVQDIHQLSVISCRAVTLWQPYKLFNIMRFDVDFKIFLWPLVRHQFVGR